MNSKHATLVLTWDGKRLLCEAPGANGARAKVDAAFSELPAEMRAALLEQMDRIRAREAEALRQQQLDNMQYVAQTHGKAFGEQVYGKLAFSHALQRYRLAQDNPNRRERASTKVQVSADQIEI